MQLWNAFHKCSIAPQYPGIGEDGIAIASAHEASLRAWPFPGLGHVFGLKHLIQLFLGEPALLQDQVVDRAARFESFLGNRGGLLVAENRIKGGHQPNAALHHVLVAVLVRLDASNATQGQYAAGLAEERYALQLIVDNDSSAAMVTVVSNPAS